MSCRRQLRCLLVKSAPTAFPSGAPSAGTLVPARTEHLRSIPTGKHLRHVAGLHQGLLWSRLPVSLSDRGTTARHGGQKCDHVPARQRVSQVTAAPSEGTRTLRSSGNHSLIYVLADPSRANQMASQSSSLSHGTALIFLSLRPSEHECPNQRQHVMDERRAGCHLVSLETQQERAAALSPLAVRLRRTSQHLLDAARCSRSSYGPLSPELTFMKPLLDPGFLSLAAGGWSI